MASAGRKVPEALEGHGFGTVAGVVGPHLSSFGVVSTPKEAHQAWFSERLPPGVPGGPKTFRQWARRDCPVRLATKGPSGDVPDYL